jgi:tRNA 5-methylaminomethyl-2-thiouridine biosynthesis bifunctional protein
VREGLSSAGFAVARRAGFGRKREMLTAQLASSSAVTPEAAVSHEAVVIGAGLAGTSCAAQLAARGWRVQLIERHGAPAQEASGNPAGLLMPAFSLDWNPSTRLTVQSFIYAVRWLDTLPRAGRMVDVEQHGVLQLARDEAHVERQRRIVEAFALPEELVQLAGRDEGSEIAGTRVAGPGWWLPSARRVDPASVCRANLALGGAAVETLFNLEAAQLRRAGEQWEVFDRSGQLLARAPTLVLANAHAAALLPGCEQLPLGLARGQLSLIPQRPGPTLNVPVCREGFITPASDGYHCLGASYSLDSETRARAEDHAGNLDRLERLLPGFGVDLDPSALEGRVGFRAVSPDRMPLVGSHAPDGGDPQHNGLFACLGLASRGLTWAPLLGETVACLAAREPLPLERDLLRLLEPGRFTRRS